MIQIVNFSDGSIGSGPNAFDPSEFPSLGGGSGGGGLPGRPNYGELYHRKLEIFYMILIFSKFQNILFYYF